LDPRTAAAISRKAVGTITADAYWERVELDACVLKVRVVDKDGIEIGRPVMYAAVDVCTGYPVAVYITILKPSSVAFVECLRTMYVPRGKEFDDRYKILNRIEIFGKPYLLVVDNGSELIGAEATAVVKAFLGDSARCRPYQPWEKPHIERFNGIVQNYVSTLPGSTKSTRYAAPRDPLASGEQLLEFEQLCGRVYRFIYDKYAYLPNELRSLRAGKAVAPADLWKLMQSTHIGPIPISEREFDSTMYFEHGKGRLRHDGVGFDGWTYHSGDLDRMHAEFGDCDVQLLASPLSARFIHVIHPTTRRSIEAEDKVIAVDMDRKSAHRFKGDIEAAGKVLSERTFAASVAELGEHAAYAKATRTRAKQARLEAMMDVAVEHARRTMPLSGAGEGTNTPAREGWDFQADAGHMRGDD
jgi:hypothetical protein